MIRPLHHAQRLAGRLGPGLITGAADDDPSGLATYSQAGAQFGAGLLWTLAFTTPLMNANQKYFYTLKVTLVRDGETITENQRVMLTPGQEARVDFNPAIALRTSSR